MSLEAIQKFDPSKCAYIRGSDGFGAHASLCNASAAGFDVYGVFRDQADFTVLVVWDADNIYDHYSIRYLPDFNVSGTVLSFTIQYGGPSGGGPQPLDSPKFSWVDWAGFDLVDGDGNVAKLPLFDYATLDTSAGSTYTPATGIITFTAAAIYAQCVLVVNNKSFLYDGGARTADAVAEYFANAINLTDWSTFEFADLAVTGTVVGGGTGQLRITYGRTGTVTASGTSVTWVAGNKFSGLQAGDPIRIGASIGNPISPVDELQYTVAAVLSPTSLTLSSVYSGGSTGSGVSYLAPYGGEDGNLLTVYALSDGTSVTATPAVLTLRGGDSYSARWNIGIDFADSITWAKPDGATFFSAPITTLRQMWLTFAPALADGAVYADTEWWVKVTNWSATAAGSVLDLKCAGQNSVRIGAFDSWTAFSPAPDLNPALDAPGTTSSFWVANANDTNTYLGRDMVTSADPARVAKFTPSGVTGSGSPAVNYPFTFSGSLSIPANSITIRYSCGVPHDLYLGTFLYLDRGEVTVTIDGTALTTLDCFLSVSAALPTRRKLNTASIAAGSHVVVLSVSGIGQDALYYALGQYIVNSGGSLSLSASPDVPFYFAFDYLEAAVPSDIPTLTQPLANVSPALDYDTDQTYKLSPERIMWQLDRLGFQGDLNLYIGVFFWNQRVRGTNATFIAAAADTQTAITFSGTPNAGDNIWINLNGAIPVTSGTGWEPTDGTTYYKLVTALETLETIARHMAYYINSGSVALWAAVTASGADYVLTLTLRSVSSPIYFTSSVRAGNVNQSSSTTVTVGSVGTNEGTQIEGDWVIDSTAGNPVNYPTRQFLAALYALCAAKSPAQQCVSAFSMELVNPPDEPNSPHNPGVMSAQFQNGEVVKTGTGVAYNNVILNSTQCAPVSTLTTFQQAAFLTVAGLQEAAGLTPWLQFGEFLWWFFCESDAAYDQQSVPIGFLSFTTPISVGTAAPHNLNTGDRVIISGVQGMTSANGTWPITVSDATHYTLAGSAPNAAWVTGTGLWSGGTMAYYDSETTSVFAAANGRSLATFTCQDDDPAAVNGGVDATFLASRLKTHVDAIRTAVVASYPAAKFELLYPDDVNHRTCISTASVPYPQGGRLNAAVNLPADWGVKSASGLDRIKIECLSWGSQYRNLDLPKQAMALFTSSPNTWPPADLAYLVPIFNGGCPWQAEFLAAANIYTFSEICLWAYDHIVLMSWPMPLLANAGLVKSS